MCRHLWIRFKKQRKKKRRVQRKNLKFLFNSLCLNLRFPEHPDRLISGINQSRIQISELWVHETTSMTIYLKVKFFATFSHIRPSIPMTFHSHSYSVSIFSSTRLSPHSNSLRTGYLLEWNCEWNKGSALSAREELKRSSCKSKWMMMTENHTHIHHLYSAFVCIKRERV